MRPPARIVVSATAFRGSLSAPAACATLAAGLRRAWPAARVDEIPVADGGDGTLDSLLAAGALALRSALVTGPLGAPVSARLGWLAGEGGGAVVESAEACGLGRVPLGSRRPLVATTRGVGELLGAALSLGARQVVLGLGGSASSDGGAGLAQALGFRLLDRAGRELGPGGGALRALACIVSPDSPAWRGAELLAACDVQAPLLGQRGAARQFGPQKGAEPAEVEALEEGLARLAERWREDLGQDVALRPGAGAAGGLGGGLMAFLGARMVSGVEWVLERIGLEARIIDADLVVTGEGQADGQSLEGKAVLGVARLAERLGVPVALVAGRLGPGAERLKEHGVRWLRTVDRGELSLDQALQPEVARRLLEQAALELALELQSTT
ncbi:MAG TPA: glycerate kinase [Myxococcota bacterium]|nr:glycerate kinase [Myxococcota bacterium]HRY94146.1 glycerate kinase [Myxococcota bacterium]HSA21879.1 glycerate kinase [Myxococcota bacterium]